MEKLDELLIVTRVHCRSANAFCDVSKIVNFVQNCSSFASKVLICVGVGESLEFISILDDIKSALSVNNLSDRVLVQPICPWGNFTTSLNIAINIGNNIGYKFIGFQSLEVTMNLDQVNTLLRYFDDSCLVVGPVFTGHEFSQGKNKLRGRTCPWNTFAIWSLSKLSVVGFPLIGDGMAGKVETGGVEEVSAVLLACLLHPLWTAKLIQLTDTTWNTNFNDDEERQKYHERKMMSKDTRPALHIEAMNLSHHNIQVQHINVTFPTTSLEEGDVSGAMDDTDPTPTPLFRQAQCILPGLFLGPRDVILHPCELERYGITAIASVLAEEDWEGNVPPTIVRKHFLVNDRVEAEVQMDERLIEAVSAIHEWRSAGHVVYVHCMSGISRSATVTIAYLMKYVEMKLMEAYKHVFDIRPVINPNDGFFRSLQKFAETECGIIYYTNSDEVDKKNDVEDLRAYELNLYNAYQLVAQLDFASVTLADAKRALQKYHGDVSASASYLLGGFK